MMNLSFETLSTDYCLSNKLEEGMINLLNGRKYECKEERKLMEKNVLFNIKQIIEKKGCKEGQKTQLPIDNVSENLMNKSNSKQFETETMEAFDEIFGQEERETTESILCIETKIRDNIVKNSQLALDTYMKENEISKLCIKERNCNIETHESNDRISVARN